MNKKIYDARKSCFEQLLTSGTKEDLARALQVETHQYTRYDLVHKAR
ncbi:MAG: hypothetical protein HDQ87_05930 [Clostridia bacterium]|nr:hypothetical protein [Clostridia bacterium]